MISATGVCPPDSLLAPEPLSPSKMEIEIDLSPDFYWEYAADCDPESFTIEVIYHPLMGIHEPVMTIQVEGFRRSWSSDKFLPEGKHYGWRISASSGESTGPSSDYALFFSGPLCEESTLLAPDLVLPREDVMVIQRRPWLQWRYAEACLPDTYYVELAESPSFADANLAAELDFPTWGRTANEPLTDCTQYFWRVAAQAGGQTGPFSPTWNFWTDFTGACNFAPPDASE